MSLYWLLLSCFPSHKRGKQTAHAYLWWFEASYSAEVGGTIIERVHEASEVAWQSLYSSFLTNVSNNLVCLRVLQRAFCPVLSLANTEDQINWLSQIFNLKHGQIGALMLHVYESLCVCVHSHRYVRSLLYSSLLSDIIRLILQI